MIRALTVITALAMAPAANAACRQALALGLDVSGSVDAREYRLQLDGLATALASADVQAALLAQGSAPVRILVYEWSGPMDQTVILPWTTITNEADLVGAIAHLQSFARADASPTTAIGSAMIAGFAYLTGQEDCWTRTLDISGDGRANTGPRPQDVPIELIPKGTIVNGLVIGAGDPAIGDQRLADIKELSSYFESYVIRGPGAFVETALGFEDYAQAMERKLLRELTSLAIGGLQ